MIIDRDAEAALLRQLDAYRDDGLRGQRFDGDGTHSSGRPDSHPETALMTEPVTREARARRKIADAASSAHERYRTLAREIRSLEAYWMRANGEQSPVPARTKPASDRCPVCWAGGRSKRKAPGRGRCHPCQHFRDVMAKRDHPDVDYPATVLTAHIEATARLASEGMRREKAEVQAWDEPSVHRAWQAAGWVTHPGDRYPVGRVEP